MLSYIRKIFTSLGDFIFRKKLSLKNLRTQKKSISHEMIIEKRIFIISIAQFSFFGVLLSRLFYLQIINVKEMRGHLLNRS